MTLSSQTEIKKLLRELDPAVANGESVQHALRVRDTCPTDVQMLLTFVDLTDKWAKI
jgi:hypothetical protein